MSSSNLVNVEKFQNSDEWLSEQMLVRLKGNETEKGLVTTRISSNGVDVDVISEEPLNLTTGIENFVNVLKRNGLTEFVTSEEVMSSVVGKECNVESAVLDLPATEIPLTLKAHSSQDSVTLDGSEDEMNLLRLLEAQSKPGPFDGKFCMQPELPTKPYRIIKCFNCNCFFDVKAFQSHICDYDEHQNLIADTATSTPLKQPKPETSLLPPEPACLRLLRENQIRIRRFLKDKLKYDVNAATSSAASSNNGHSSSPSNSNGNKKQFGPHECTLCDRKFVHASGLLRHMEKHTMDLIPAPRAAQSSNKTSSAVTASAFQNMNGLRVVIKCSLCGRIFFDPSSSHAHLCSHFPESIEEEREIDNSAEIPYECYVDDAINVLNAELEATGSTFSPTSKDIYFKMVILSCVLQCEFCDYIFAEVSYLFVHSACHLPERRFECFACEIHLRTSKEICTHWQTECVFMRENIKVHKAITQRFFVCNVCESKFQSLDQLHKHRYSDSHFFPRLHKGLGILQLPCEYCDEVSEHVQECIAHYKEKHFKKNKRDKDGAGSSEKSRQYLCDICGKSYTQSSHLWQHLRFHQGVKPFACEEPGCSRKFTIRPDLNDHIRKCHTGERPYHCLVCGKRFLTGSVFYQHRLIHRGERRYECEECGKRFYRADALKNHQRIHTGEKPFGCLFCTKNFRQRGDRDKHVRARHSHLDANARLMMQMQKMQLETAAAAAAAQKDSPQEKNLANISQAEHTENQDLDPDDVVMISNVAFPKSMFESIIPDIDEEVALNASQMP